jgi:hypothetical protein
MDKVITSGLLIIGSIAAAIALINAVIPAMSESSSAMSAANSAASERIRTDIEVVHVAALPDDDQIIIWVKNVGANNISAIESSDIFLEMPGTVKQLSHGAGSGSEYWTYVLENGTEWTQGVTLKMTANLSGGSVVPGSYIVTISLYNAVSATKDFSV